MPSRGLPENVDSAYADDATHPDVKVHQQHHDTIHDFVNLWDDATPTNGHTLFWSSSLGLWYSDDPATGGTGPAGEDGHGLRYLGNYDAGTTYFPFDGTTHLQDDLVTYDGSVYICLVSSTGSTPPTSTTNWGLFASKGATGAQGVKGDQGVPGPQVETLNLVPSSGVAVTLSDGDGSVHEVYVDDDVDITLDGAALGAMTAVLHQNGAGHTVTFTDPIAWEGGSAPTLQVIDGKSDILTFLQVSGSWYGFASALDVDTPVPVAPTLDVEFLGSTLNPGVDAASFTTGTVTFEDGDMGIVAYVSTLLADSPTVSVPTVAGGGMTGWTAMGTEQNFNETGAQRKFGLFYCRQTTAGAGAPVTFTYPITMAGCQAMVLRVPGTAVTAPALAVSKYVTAKAPAVGWTAPTVTLAAASDAANRPIGFFFGQVSSTAFTPGANLAVVTGASIVQTSPSITLVCEWRSGAFQTTVNGTWATLAKGCVIATELEQG